jgi:hypothetical protein
MEEGDDIDFPRTKVGPPALARVGPGPAEVGSDYVGEGPPVGKEVLEKKECACILFTIMAMIRRQRKTYERTEAALSRIPHLIGKAELEIPLYRFLNKNTLSEEDVTLKFFATFFPDLLEETPDGVLNDTHLLFKETLGTAGVNFDAMSDRIKPTGNRMRVKISATANFAVLGITNVWDEKEQSDNFWHITVPVEPEFVHKKGNPYRMPSKKIKDAIHFTSEREEDAEGGPREHSFVDFYNFDKTYNPSAEALKGSLNGHLEYGMQIESLLEDLGGDGKAFEKYKFSDQELLYPAQQPRDKNAGPGPVVGGPRPRHGGSITSSSHRLLYGPTRKVPSSARGKRRTHRKRALRSGKVGYRATRTGRKV